MQLQATAQPAADVFYATLQLQVGTWSKHNFPNNTVIKPLVGIVEEVGELSHAILKADQGIRGTKEEHEANIVDSIADACIFAADYSSRAGINMYTVEPGIRPPTGRIQQALGLSGAVGKLAEMYEFSNSVQQWKAEQALGLVLRRLEWFCVNSQLDFQTIVWNTWKEVSRRDWVTFPKDGLSL